MDPITVEAEGLVYKTSPVVIGGDSTQQSEFVDDIDGTISPPLALEQLVALSEWNQTRESVIDATVRNTVGLGYEIRVKAGREREIEEPEKLIARARVALEAAARRDLVAGLPSFTEQLVATKRSEEECGNGGLEISRNKTSGKIDGIFRVPGHRVRRLKDRSGYVLLPPGGDIGDGTYFANYGTKVVYDDDGQPTTELQPGHRGGWLRNEYVPFMLSSSLSRDYGMPRDHAMFADYLGEKLAAIANADFFANGGTLPTVLFIQGEERQDGKQINVTLGDSTVRKIESILKSSGRGPTSGGRVAIVPLPAGVKAQKEVLGAASERDMGHVVYREDIRQRTLSAWRLGPIFIGLMDEGRYSAEVQRALGKEQVFDPEQERYQGRVDWLAELGYPDLEVVLNDLAIEDDAAKRSSAEKMAEVGTVTNGEHREAHGYAPLTEADQSEAEIEWGGETWRSAEPAPGQVPFGWNAALVKPPAAGKPAVAEGDGQQGLRPGLAGRGSRDDGQAASAADPAVAAQTRRLAGRTAGVARGGARRAAERAKTLPDG